MFFLNHLTLGRPFELFPSHFYSIDVLSALVSFTPFYGLTTAIVSSSSVKNLLFQLLAIIFVRSLRFPSTCLINAVFYAQSVILFVFIRVHVRASFVTAHPTLLLITLFKYLDWIVKKQ
jgi:hypothetical protein